MSACFWANGEAQAWARAFYEHEELPRRVDGIRNQGWSAHYYELAGPEAAEGLPSRVGLTLRHGREVVSIRATLRWGEGPG
jgi:hypothetical protein